MDLTGYLNPGYARALAEFGTPVELPRSGGWFLKRAIPGQSAFDGMGCYPYLTCLDWSALSEDLTDLENDLVSFAAVPDPFGGHSPEDLQHAFPDLRMHFKDHYVSDLRQPIERIMSPRRRRHAKAVMRKLDVEVRAQPVGLLDEWMALFSLAIQRFQLTGIRAYSRASFAQQLALPGSYMSLARHDGEMVGAHIFLVHGDTGYAHIGAASPKGRANSVDSALYYAGIEYFSGKVSRLDWGGEAGINKAENADLGSFKRGWTSGTSPVYFCGRIFDKRRYDQIRRARGIQSELYFPAYRQGEFN